MDWTRTAGLWVSVGLAGCFAPESGSDGESGTGATAQGSSGGGPISDTNAPSTSGAGDTMGATAATTRSTTGDPDTTAGDEESTAAPPVCPADHTCVPEAPPDWTGPVILYEGSAAAPDCPGEYPGLEIDATDGLSADPALCGCACDGTALCGPAQFSHLGGCTLPTILYGTDTIFLPNSCMQLQEPVNAVSINVGLHNEEQSGSCAPAPEPAAITPVQWDTNARVCGGPFIREGCGGGEVCTPSPPAGFDGAVCVYRQGVSGCPLDFPVQHSYFTDVDDTRDCSTCTCGGLQTPVECSATVRLSSQSDCSNQAVPDFTVQAPVCQSKVSTMDYARFTNLTLTSGGCSPQGGQPQGAAVPTGDLTVCCAS